MIKSSESDPCDLNILTNIDKSKDKQDNQTFYCHASCFEQKLDESVRGYLVVHIADDE